MSDFYEEGTDELDQECIDIILENATTLLNNEHIEYLAVVPRGDNQVELDVWAKGTGSPQGIFLTADQVTELIQALNDAVRSDA